MKSKFPLLSFIISIALIAYWFGTWFFIPFNVTLFRILSIVGTITALLLAYVSEKGRWRNFAFGVAILISIIYYIVVELMRLLFRGNGF